MLRCTAALLTAATLAVCGGPAHAIVLNGPYPKQQTSYQVYGKAVQLGASLMTGFTDPRFADALLPSSTDSVSVLEQIPADAQIVAARMYWTGRSVNNSTDTTASLTLPDGFAATVNSDTCETLSLPVPGGGSELHYYCRADVTQLVADHPGGQGYNGTYQGGSVTARPAEVQFQGCGNKWNGQPETVCCKQTFPQDLNCQTAHASWSLVLVYDTAFSDNVRRDVFLYDGFVALDERIDSTGQITFTIDGFLVADPPEAQIAYHAMEGDAFLGNPAQDPPGGPNSPPCATCFDYISFNGTKLSGGAGNSSPNNIFNGTPEVGVDLDSFDVSALVSDGDQQATLVMSSGDGDLTNNGVDQISQIGGYGELLFLGYTLLQVNRKAPRFQNAFTSYKVTPTTASPGTTLSYEVDLQNDGPLAAENAVLTLDNFPPPGTSYVPGTTVVDGQPVADIGGQSALAGGLSLGDIATNGPVQFREVRFQVAVNDPAGVPEVLSTATVSFSYAGGQFQDSYQTNQTVVDIVEPSFAAPQLTVSPNPANPGDTTTWTLTVQSTSGSAQTLDEIAVLLPAELNLLSVSGPGTNQSTPGVGGEVRLVGVPLGANGQLTVTFQAALRDVDALTALGINPIDGHLISVQGGVSAAGLFSQTDNPATAGPADPTVLEVDAEPDLSGSAKLAADQSPGTPLLPGDLVRFTIRVANAGPGPVTVNVSDPLPSGMAFEAAISPALSFSGGVITASNVTVAAGAQTELVFDARVNAATAPGTNIVNTATLAPTNGQPPVVVSSPQLTVEGGPDLTTSSKIVVDLNGGDVEPGDVLRYTITVANTGQQGSGAVQIADPLDTNLENPTGITGGGSFDAASNAVVWSLGAVAAGSSVQVSFDATVKAGTVNGTSIANIATISAAQVADPLSVQALVNVSASPLISVLTNTVTSSGGAAFEPSDTITYTLTVQNTGKGAATGAALTMPLAGLISPTSASDGGQLSGQTVTWQLGDLPPGGAPITVTVQGTLADVVPQGAQVSAQASLTAGGLGAPALSDDPGVPGPTDPTVFTVESAPVLSASTKAFSDSDGGEVQGGDVVTFTIELVNTGNAPATNVVVTDPLNAALTGVQVEGGSFAGGVATWPPIGSLEPGAAPVVLTLSATVAPTTPSGAVIANTGQIAFDETPGSAQTNTVSFTVQNVPDFAASTKAVSAALIGAGEQVTFTLTARNDGNAAATGVVMTDVVPLPLTNINAIGGSFDAATRTATWALGTVAAGAVVTRTLTATVPSPQINGTQVCNQATIDATETTGPVATSPPNVPPQLGGEPTCFVINSEPALSVLVSVLSEPGGAVLNQGTIKPGTTVRYRITLQNDGTALAENVAFGLPLDTAIFAAGSVQPSAGGSFAGGVVSWGPIAQLGVGAANALTFDVVATLQDALDDGLPISAQVVATFDDAAGPVPSDDPTTPTAGDPTLLTVVSAVDFSAALKTVVDSNGGDARPGDELVWTIALANQGDAVAKNAVITDPIDPRLVDVVPSDGGVFAAGAITWQLGDVAPGDPPLTRSFTAKLATPLPNGAVVPNQAQISADGFAAPVLTDADLATPVKDPTTVVVTSSADFSTSDWTLNDLNGGAVEPGDTLVFELTLRNTGDAVAVQLPVDGQLVGPTPAALASVTPFDGGVLAPSGDSVAWTVPTVALSPGGDVSLRFSATVADGTADGTVLRVQAPLPGLANAPFIEATVQSQPDLSTSTVAVENETGWIEQIGQAGPGHLLRVAVNVVNTGTADAGGVTVSVPLDPALLTSVQAISPGATITGGGIAWQLGALAPGQSAQLLFRVQIVDSAQDGAPVPLDASVSGGVLPAPVVLPAPPVVVVRKPVLTLTVDAEDIDGGHVVPGDAVRWTITVANAGNEPTDGLVVRTPVPAGLLGANAASGSIVGNNAEWALAPLAAGQSTTLLLEGLVADTASNGATLAVLASAEASNAEPATAPASVLTVQFGVLQLSAAFNPQPPGGVPAKPGDQVVLNVTVGNTGPVAASGVEVTLPIDQAVFEVVGLSGGSFDAGAGVVRFTPSSTATLTAVAPGTQVSLGVVLKVRPTATDGTVASSLGEASEAETGRTYTADAAATLPIEAIPQLVFEKRVVDDNGAPARPLDRLTYTLRLRVEGGTAAQGVTIGDTLPPQLDPIAISDGGVANGNVLTWTPATTPALALMQPGAVVEVAVEARIRAEVADGTVVANQAVATAQGLDIGKPSDDPRTADAEDPTAVTVQVSSPLASSTKRGVDTNGGVLLPGDTITWRIVLLATGDAPLSNTVLSDTIPAGTTYVAGSTAIDGAAVPDVGGTSALVGGLPVQSPGAAPGVVQPGTGDAVVVTFQTRVGGKTLDGTVISNVATVQADGVPPTAVGPATMVVGAGPTLARTTKRAELIDENGNGLADPGESLRYRISVVNDGGGAAQDVELTDVLPAGAEWLPGTLRIDGAPVSDAVDADAGGYDPAERRVIVRLGEVAAKATREVVFRVRLGPVASLSNQAIVTADGLPAEPSDADEDDSNGDQPTITPIASGPLLAVDKRVEDVDGGVTRAGDALRYVITVRNEGNADATGVSLVDALPDGLAAEPAPVVDAPEGAQSTLADGVAGGPTLLTVDGLTVRAGETRSIVVRTPLRADLAAGAVVCNTARLVQAGPDGAGQAPIASEPACVTVGARAGEGALQGAVFEETATPDGAFTEGADLPFAGYQVIVQPPEGLDGPTLSAITDEAGRYQIAHVPAGPRRVRVVSPTGVTFLQASFDFDPTSASRLDLPLAPTGRVFDASAGTLVAGARLSLFYDALDPIAPGEKVPDDQLPAGQQDQITDATGAYIFAAPAGRTYRISVAPDDGLHAFPSLTRPAEAGLALLDGDGFVVEPAVPSAARTDRYYLRFSRQGSPAAPAPRRNHLPVDALRDTVRVSVHLSRREALVGEVVFVTVQVDNASSRGFAASALTGDGGLRLEHVLPSALKLLTNGDAPLRGSLRKAGAEAAADVDVLHDGEAGLISLQRAAPITGEPVGFDLPPGAKLEVRLRAMVLPGAPAGSKQTFRARVVTAALGEAISDDGRATLRVAADPLFDRGMVYVRAFCDVDGDGALGDKDRGLPGVRVYADNGYYTDLDVAGRGHFRDVQPGMHLFKLDEATLPPGAKLKTSARRLLSITPGMPVSVAFVAQCPDDLTRPDEVERAPAPPVEVIDQVAGPGVLTVSGDVDKLEVAVDGKPLRPQSLRASLQPNGAIDDTANDVPVVLAATGALKVRLESEGRFSRHRVTIRELDAAGLPARFVREHHTRKPPGKTLELAIQQGGVSLDPGRRYALQVVAETAYGARAASGWLPFELHPTPDKAPAPTWRRGTWPRELLIEGLPAPLEADGRFDVQVERPPSGQLLIRLARGDGSLRVAYVTVRRSLPLDRYTPPEPETVGGFVDVAPGAAPQRTTAPAPTPTPEAEPKPAPAPQPEPKPQPKPEPKPQPKPEPQPTPTPTPKAGATTTAATTTAAATAAANPLDAARLGAGLPPLVATGPAGTATLKLDTAVSDGLRIGATLLVPTVKSLEMKVADALVPLSAGRLVGRLVVQTKGVPANAAGARMVLLDAQGDVAGRATLGKRLPRTFFWDAVTLTPRAALKPGRYGLALEVLVDDGDGGLIGWRSKPSAIRVVADDPALVPDIKPDREVQATLANRRGQLTDEAAAWVDRTAEKIRRATNKLAIVAVHGQGAGAKKRTAALAAQVRERLLAGGARADRTIVFGAGAARPAGFDAELGPDRVTVHLLSLVRSSSTPPRGFPIPAGLWVNGEATGAGADGKPATSVTVPRGRPVLVVLQRTDGQAALWQRVLAAQPPGGDQPPATPTDPASPRLVGFGSSLLDAVEADLDDKAKPSADNAKPSADNAKPSADNAKPSADNAKPSPDKTKASAGNAKPSAHDADRAVARFDAEASDNPKAADLQVRLPPDGSKLGGPQLPIVGRTDPTNTLRINGRPQVLDEDGGFYALLQFEPGDKPKVTIETEDREGHKARITRRYEVPVEGLFLLALAEGAVSGVHNRIPGMTDRTTVDTGPVALHGRGAVYLKGYVKGDVLGFEKLRYTAHVDTARDPALQDQQTNLFDPNRFYPVYGDEAGLVQDALSRGPLYVLVEADRSKLQIGNFRSGVNGYELIRYDRALYGARVDFRKKIGGIDHRAHVFAADERGELLRRTDLLRGTGGSLYYLSGQDVLEGSEQIHLVVRDRDSNVELARFPQQRNNDYTVDYREGRLLFASPVSMAVDAFFVTSHGLLPGQQLHWNGHPVFVEAVYQARALQDQGATPLGVEVDEKLLGGKLEVGGAYVQEARQGSDPTYRLTGGHAQVNLGERSRVRAEYAWSEARDSQVSVSDDGGLTFGGYRGEGVYTGEKRSGHALHLSLDADFADVGGWLGFEASPVRPGSGAEDDKGDATARGGEDSKDAKDSKDTKDTTAAKPPAHSRGQLRAYYKWVQAGFHSNGVLVEQGQQKIGASSRFAVTADNSLSLRYDGIVTGERLDRFAGNGLEPLWGTGAAATSGTFSPWQRHLVTAQDEHRMGVWTFVGSAGWAHGATALGGTTDTGTLTAGAVRRLGTRWTLRADQQLVLGADPTQIQTRGLDHLNTRLGVDYKLDKDLAIVVDERIGWGGQNSTSAGLRTQLDESSRLYVQQRLDRGMPGDPLVGATVVGAESRYGDKHDGQSRAYGEYQVDATNPARMNRAVMGVGKRFVIAPGLHLDAGYERMQTFGGPTGELARDAVSVGGEWLRDRRWKLTTRQELRLDTPDRELGGHRKVQLVSLTNMLARVTPEVGLFGRGFYTRTTDQTAGRIEAESAQATFGAAYRPLRSRWLEVVTKYSYLVDARPSSTNQGAATRSQRHVVGLEPVAELPLGIQWSNKFAWRQSTDQAGDFDPITSDVLLYGTRLGYHWSRTLDVYAEYRWLHTPLTGDLEQGVLLEAAWLLADHARLGLGYNFARFLQDPVTGDVESGRGGFFVRVIGMY